MSTGAAEPPPRRSRSRLARLVRVGVHVLAAVGAWSLLFPLVFETSRIVSDSMAPLLRGGVDGKSDTVLIETRFTAGTAPERFQVVAYVDPELEVLVTKRVVAVGGETLVVTAAGDLVIDGVAYPAPAGVGRGRGYLAVGRLIRDRPFAVPAGHVFLLGDDSQDSYDSRFTGPLPVERIRGRVVARVWPLDRLELL